MITWSWQNLPSLLPIVQTGRLRPETFSGSLNLFFFFFLFSFGLFAFSRASSQGIWGFPG